MRGLMANLPRPIHFVAKAPIFDAERRFAAVALAEVAPVASRGPVGVFNQVARLVETARTKVDGEHHLGVDGLAPLGEFMQADGVGLAGVPGQIKSHRALLARPNAVFPVVGGDEIAAGIAHERHVEIAHELHDVAAHAVLVGGWMARFVDAGVDRAAEVFEERAIEAVIDAGDGVIAMGGDGRLHVSSLSALRLCIRFLGRFERA